MSSLDLVGVVEAAAILGWKKQQLRNYFERAEKKQWPEGMLPRPDQLIGTRPFWIRETMVHYRNYYVRKYAVRIGFGSEGPGQPILIGWANNVDDAQQKAKSRLQEEFGALWSGKMKDTYIGSLSFLIAESPWSEEELVTTLTLEGAFE